MSTRPSVAPAFATRTQALILFAVFGFALGLRLWRLDEQSLWYDEVMTLEAAQVPLDQLPTWLQLTESNKPPLYFALVHYLVQIASGDYWLRFPSVIFGSISCAGAALIGIQMLGPRWGWGVGLLLALSPLHVFYSQEARMYTLWGLFTTAAIYFNLKYCESSSLKSLGGYGIFACLGCYTFTYGVFLIGFSILFSFAHRPVLSKRALALLVGGNASVLLLFTPWILRIVSGAAAGVGFQVTPRGSPVEAASYAFYTLAFGTTFGPSLETLQLFGKEVFRRTPVLGTVLIVGCLVFALLLSLGFFHYWRTNRNLVWFSAAGLGAFWLAPALLSAVSPGIPYNPRYAFPAILPGLILLCGAAQMVMQNRWIWIPLCLYAVGTTFSLYNYFLVPAYGRDDMRAAAQFLREVVPQPERVVICAGHLKNVLNHYWEGIAPVKAVIRVKPEPSEDSLEAVGKFTSGAHRFALIYSRPDHGDPDRSLPEYLKSRYRTIEYQYWPGVESLS